MAVYPQARMLFYREHSDNCYSVLTFLLTYTLLELPFTAISALAFGAFTYGINLRRTASFTFIAAFNCFAVVTCGESIGIMFCTLLKGHMGFGIQVMSVILSIGQIMGGVFSLNLPGFLQAWNYLSPVKYATDNIAPYAMRGQRFSCSDAQKIDGVCPLATGEQVLKLYNLDRNPGVNLAGLGACVVVYRLVAFLILWAARARWDWDGVWAFVKFTGRSKGQGQDISATNRGAVEA